MSYLNEAFRALDALNEDTFSINDDGIKKLSEFEADTDFEDEVKVIDPDADSEEDLEDSYVGKVILDCCVCHSKLYKDEEDVKISDDEELANIDEECPYCYSTEGFKIIGEVSEFESEEEKEETDKDDEDEKSDEEEEIEVEEDKEEIIEEGLFEKQRAKKSAKDESLLRESSVNLNGLSKEEVANFIIDHFKTITTRNIEDIFSKMDGDVIFDQDIVDRTAPDIEDFLMRNTNWSQRDIDDFWYIFDEILTNKYSDYIDFNESLKEDKKDLTKTKGTIAKALSDNMDKLSRINNVGEMKQKVIEIISDCDATAEQKKKALAKISSPKSTSALLSTLATYMTGIKAEGFNKSKLQERFINRDLRDFDPEELMSKVAETGKSLHTDLYDVETGTIYSVSIFYKEIFGNRGIENPDELYWVDIVAEDKDGNQERIDIANAPKYDTYEGIVDTLNTWKDDMVKSSYNESLEHVNVETEDSVVEVSSTEEGEVNVSTRKKEEASDGDEFIVPVSDETKDEIEMNSLPEDEIEQPEEVEEIDEFDEESFDELGESYLKRVYENVESYKTKKVTTKGKQLVIEGVIKFTSGNKKQTSFIFEKRNTNKGKVRLIGENVNITRGKKSFAIKGQFNKDKKFITESFNYNYMTKNNDGKSVKLYGTIKR